MTFGNGGPPPKRHEEPFQPDKEPEGNTSNVWAGIAISLALAAFAGAYYLLNDSAPIIHKNMAQLGKAPSSTSRPVK